MIVSQDQRKFLRHLIQGIFHRSPELIFANGERRTANGERRTAAGAAPPERISDPGERNLPRH
jgi:hypothetical protein